MTKQDFNNTRYGAGMHVKLPNGKIKPLLGVDFEQYFFGIEDPNSCDELLWFNCEGCELFDFSKKRGSKIIKIGDGLTTPLHVIGYAIFEDNFVSEKDKYFINKEGMKYFALDFKEIIEEKIKTPSIKLFHVKDYSVKGYGVNEEYSVIYKRSCIKFDKPFTVGDILYIENND